LNGGAVPPSKASISFRRVEKLEVGAEEEAQNRVPAQNGVRSTIAPVVFRLALKYRSGEQVMIRLRDEDTATRMAKAMTHATELCGGGSKDPF
jgi:hypothetical protein